MPDRPDELLERIEESTRRLDRAEAQRAVDDLVAAVYDLQGADEPFPAETAAKILGVLRKKRYFEEMEKAADAFLDCGLENLTVQRQYLQALIDRKQLASARGEVEALIGAARDDPKEYAEARGLKGRILKQSYVDAGPHPSRAARRDLAGAIESYAEVYHEDPKRHYWHGINVVACLARCRRDGVDPRSDLDENKIAREILAHISTLNRRNPWNMWAWGTAMEAHIALGEIDEAGRWLEIYLQGREADAFELTSTYRQLIEVWQLDKTGPGGDLLKAIHGELLTKTGGHVELQGAEPLGEKPSRDLQARWGPHSARKASWLDKLTRKLGAVAHVEQPDGTAIGTGFLVYGEELHGSWRGRQLLLTNSHVIDQPAHPHGIEPGRARIRFTRHASAAEEGLRVKMLWSSNWENLDLSIHRLERPPEKLEALLLAGADDIQAYGHDETARLIVAGHPDGREMETTIENNYLKELDSPLVFYNSPTEKGSSGSPVLTEDCEAVAIHRAENQDRKANEGVLADALKKALSDNPPADAAA